jgi:hypothetical protein
MPEIAKAVRRQWSEARDCATDGKRVMARFPS